MKNYLLEEVSDRLGKVFKDMGYTIDVDQIYLTSVVIDGEGKPLVDYSESLSWAIMEKVQADELPAFNDTYAGIFFERWTFDPAYRVDALHMEQININGCMVVESFRNK